MTSVILVCGGVPVVSHCLPPLILHNSSLIELTDGEKLSTLRLQTAFYGSRLNLKLKSTVGAELQPAG